METLKTKLDSIFDACTILANGAYVYVCDLKNDYSRWSKVAIEFFNMPSEYMYKAGDLWIEHIHPEDRGRFKEEIDQIFTGAENEHRMQYRAMAKDGKYTKCTCNGTVLLGDDGRPEFFCGTIRNNDTLEYTDNVTNLRSLYGFLEDMKSAVWSGQPVQIMQLGIDDFSHLNEIYGYTFGNRVLQEFGNMIDVEANGLGSWYRMDGTKFAIVCKEATTEDLKNLYKRIQYNALHDFNVDGTRIVLSFVAGAITINKLDVSVDTIYSCLRFAYYESKISGIGELYILKENISDDKRFAIERINVIRNSIVDNCNGFFLCYQPIVDAVSEKLVGAEALIRWKNNEYGIVPPIQFVDVLEQDNLFPELGSWILRNSIRDAKKLLKDYPNFIVNVNLSYTQIKKENFAEEVERIIHEENFPPQNLCLEITERCRLLDIELLKRTFSRLRELGVKVALDDFGTGFSSIGILRELPVTTVKIDRSFVMNVKDSVSDQNTVRFISELAESFSASVCAEGIENSDARECLLKYKVKNFQGYYYSKPLVFEDFYKKYCTFE